LADDWKRWCTQEPFSDGKTTPDGVEEITNRLGDDRSWYRVDLAVEGVIGQAGFPEPHLHGPAGRHLHGEQEARRGAGDKDRPGSAKMLAALLNRLGCARASLW